MSNNRLSSEEEESTHVCANCGKKDGNEFKLKNCTACFLVKYCSVSCQKSHRKLHKKECRVRAAELKDEALFGQGHESWHGECPICMLPLPLDGTQSGLNACCMNRTCNGCNLAAIERGMNNICAFCRAPTPNGDTAVIALVQKRVDAGDAKAMYFLGSKYFYGRLGLQQDKSRVVELFREAANLGSVEAHYNLGFMYGRGDGLVGKDETKAVYHSVIAAKAGHPDARFNLGSWEATNLNYGRALKHWMIAAKMGHEDALKNIQRGYKEGFATKDDYAQALVGYQQAVEEMKSGQRKKAEVYFRAPRPSCTK